MSIFSERLKWLRNRKGLTQAQMGELLGISDRAYAKYEYKLREPNLDTLVKLPGILGESLDFITGVTDRTKEINKLMSDLSLYYGTIETQTEILKRAEQLDFDKDKILETEKLLNNYFNKFGETAKLIKELEAEIPMESDTSENQKDPQ